MSRFPSAVKSGFTGLQKIKTPATLQIKDDGRFLDCSTQVGYSRLSTYWVLCTQALLLCLSLTGRRAPVLILFVNIRVSRALGVSAILYLYTHPVILIFFLFSSPFLFLFPVV